MIEFSNHTLIADWSLPVNGDIALKLLSNVLMRGTFGCSLLEEDPLSKHVFKPVLCFFFGVFGMLN